MKPLKVAFFFALLLTSCGAVFGPGDVTDEGCEAAGKRLRELQCRSSSGVPLWESPEGTPFAVVCRDAAADGRTYNALCVSRIENCTQVSAAFRGERC